MMIFLLLGVALVLPSAKVTTAITATPTPIRQEIRIGNASASQIVSMTLPKLVSHARPLYTDEARQRGIEGVVTVQAEFDMNGSFKVLHVVKSLGHGLDENALAALKKWRFTPAYRDGKVVSVVTQIDVHFTLFDDPKWLRENIGTPESGERTFRIETLRFAVERWEMN
jgi:TonB family protein